MNATADRKPGRTLRARLAFRDDGRYPRLHSPHRGSRQAPTHKVEIRAAGPRGPAHRAMDESTPELFRVDARPQAVDRGRGQSRTGPYDAPVGMAALRDRRRARLPSRRPAHRAQPRARLQWVCDSRWASRPAKGSVAPGAGTTTGSTIADAHPAAGGGEG